MLEKFKKWFLISSAGIAVLLLVTVFILAWTISRSKTKPSPTPSIERATLSEKAQKIKKEVTQTDKESGDLILLDNDNLAIKYLISNKQFLVEIKKAPFEKGKKEAEEWFMGKGFTREDLCLLRINFGAQRTIKPSLSNSDMFPSGCPIPSP